MLTRITLGLVGLGLLAVILQVSANHYGWTSPFSNDAPDEEARPEYVMSEAAPAFGPDCGDDAMDVGGGAFSFNPDIEHHTDQSIAIVEGTAHVAGPAQFGDVAYSPDMNRSDQMRAATGIHTPFTIVVSKTHKGAEQAEWPVSVAGGLVDCVSYRESVDGVRLFDGVTGLFFINAEDPASPASTKNGVSMTIAGDGPPWFNFTESNFGTVEQAVELIGTRD